MKIPYRWRWKLWLLRGWAKKRLRALMFPWRFVLGRWPLVRRVSMLRAVIVAQRGRQWEIQEAHEAKDKAGKFMRELGALHMRGYLKDGPGQARIRILVEVDPYLMAPMGPFCSMKSDIAHYVARFVEREIATTRVLEECRIVTEEWETPRRSYGFVPKRGDL